MNNIFVVKLYRQYGAWVFDDEARGIKAEPFVAGMPQIIEKYAGVMPAGKIIEYKKGTPHLVL